MSLHGEEVWIHVSVSVLCRDPRKDYLSMPTHHRAEAILLGLCSSIFPFIVVPTQFTLHLSMYKFATCGLKIPRDPREYLGKSVRANFLILRNLEQSLLWTL